MFGLQKLKNKLNSTALDCLAKHDGELLLLKKEGSKATLVSAQIKQTRYMWGLIPLHHVTDQGWTKLSIATDVIEPITNIMRKLRMVVKNHSAGTWKIVIENMLERLDHALENTRKEAVAKITSSYIAFHQKFLANVISKSQNDYRQRLSDVVRTTGSETFSGSVQKHIAMLLVKMREEERRRTQTDYVSSGPAALPYGCKFVFKRKDASVYVIEQIPQVRTISYLGKKFRISLPYVIFVATIRNNTFMWLQVLFRTSALHNEADELMCPALPNIYDGAGKRFMICFPVPQNRNAGPAQIADEAVQNYWGSNFNKDLSAFFNAASSQFPQVRSFEEWQLHTGTNPSFAVKLAWQSAGIDVSRLANDMLNRALSIDSEKPLEQSTASALQEYALTLGDRFSREITEKIHFMVSHSHVEVDSLAPANEQLRKLIDGTVHDLREKVGKLLSAPIPSADLESLCGEAEQKLREEVEATCSRPISEITEKINQF